jgi:hypothetical protein
MTKTSKQTPCNRNRWKDILNNTTLVCKRYKDITPFKIHDTNTCRGTTFKEIIQSKLNVIFKEQLAVLSSCARSYISGKGKGHMSKHPQKVWFTNYKISDILEK